MNNIHIAVRTFRRRVINWGYETDMEFLREIERRLDQGGKPYWIGAMVVGFVLFWPIGLAMLGYMIWTERLMCGRGWKRRSRAKAYEPTGNRAFDEYREATLKRLEEERSAFEGFLDRLRRAKDQAEFEQFMTERRNGDGDDDGADPTKAAA